MYTFSNFLSIQSSFNILFHIKKNDSEPMPGVQISPLSKNLNEIQCINCKLEVLWNRLWGHSIFKTANTRNPDQTCIKRYMLSLLVSTSIAFESSYIPCISTLLYLYCSDVLYRVGRGRGWWRRCAGTGGPRWTRGPRGPWWTRGCARPTPSRRSTSRPATAIPARPGTTRSSWFSRYTMFKVVFTRHIGCIQNFLYIYLYD